MVRAPNERLLLVEGHDDRFVIANLYEKATKTTWEQSERQYLVDIDPLGSNQQVLSAVRVKWKESGRKYVGIVVDADEATAGRWNQVKAHAPQEVAGLLPQAIPTEGLVVNLPSGKRFGAWIMPDNESAGMLETFLNTLRSTSKELSDHVVKSMRDAQPLMNGKGWINAHADKAELHTWLAWQNPPGRQLHEAVMHNLLDITGPTAGAFVRWMKNLYAL